MPREASGRPTSGEARSRGQSGREFVLSKSLSRARNATRPPRRVAHSMTPSTCNRNSRSGIPVRSNRKTRYAATWRCFNPSVRLELLRQLGEGGLKPLAFSMQYVACREPVRERVGHTGGGCRSLAYIEPMPRHLYYYMGKGPLVKRKTRIRRDAPPAPSCTEARHFGQRRCSRRRRSWPPRKNRDWQRSAAGRVAGPKARCLSQAFPTT